MRTAWLSWASGFLDILVVILAVCIFFAELMYYSVFHTLDLISGAWCVFVSLDFRFVYSFDILFLEFARLQTALLDFRVSK